MAGVLAAVLEAPERLVLREFERPRVREDDALLAVELAGICGTDWKIYHGKLAYRLPLIMGHEILGRVAELGAGFAERTGLRVGDRVVVDMSVPCWACSECRGGDYRFCERGEQRVAYGTRTPATAPPHLWGAFAALMYLAPGSVVHRISHDVPAEAAVLSSVVANAIQWVQMVGGVKYQDVVVVQGCGPQGLAAAVVARECGADKVIVSGLSRDAERLALARELGADATVDVERDDLREVVRELSGGRMADVVVDVTGSPAATAAAVALVRKQGTVVVGGLSGNDALAPINIDSLVFNQVRLQGVYTKGSRAIEAGIRLIESRKYPLERMVTHRYPLERAAEAIRAIGGETPGVYPIKAAIAPA